MNEERLAQIEARCEAATPGPWRPVVGNLNTYVASGDERLQARIQGLHPKDGEPTNAAADALFVAHARTDLPDAIAEIRRLLVALERIHQLCRANRSASALRITVGTIAGLALAASPLQNPPNDVSSPTTHPQRGIAPGKNDSE